MVSPAHRRKGLARELWAHAEDDCRHYQRTTIMAHAEVKSSGHFFFPGMGFYEETILSGYAKGADGLIKDHASFVKVLPGNETRIGGHDIKKEEHIGGA